MIKILTLVILFMSSAGAFASIASYDRSNDLFGKEDDFWKLSYTLNVTSNKYSRLAQGETKDSMKDYNLQYYKTNHDFNVEFFNVLSSRLFLDFLTDYITRQAANQKSKQVSNQTIGGVYQWNPISKSWKAGRTHEFGFSLEYSKSKWKNDKAVFEYQDEVNPEYAWLDKSYQFSHTMNITTITPAINYTYVMRVNEEKMMYFSFRTGWCMQTEKQNSLNTIYDNSICERDRGTVNSKRYEVVASTYKSGGPMIGWSIYGDMNGWILYSEMSAAFGWDGSIDSKYYHDKSEGLGMMRGLINFGTGYRNGGFKIILSMQIDVTEHPVYTSNHRSRYYGPDDQCMQEYISGSANVMCSYAF